MDDDRCTGGISFRLRFMDKICKFGDLPHEYSNLEQAEIVIVPVPYDGTSTWQKGADKGPEALIDASGHMELYDIETDSQVYLKGIYTSKPANTDILPDQIVESVENAVQQYLNLPLP